MAVIQINTTANPYYLNISASTIGVDVYSNAGVGAPVRPAPGAVGAVAGVTTIMIWNFTDKAPNFSDGTNWYDADGNIT
jgi:hypothetical protein